MSKCKHIRLKFEHRKDKYGQDHKCTCSCGTVTSNWHTEMWKAKRAYNENYSDMLQRGKIEWHWG